MSNSNDEKKVNKTQNKSTYIIGGIVAVLLILLCIFLGSKGNNSTPNADSTDVATNSEVIQETQVFDMSTKIEADTYLDVDLGNVSISDKIDANTALQLQKIQDSLDNIYSQNSLVYLVVGETDADIISQFYNSEYQCYSETANNLVGIYYDRAKSIIISDIVERVEDATAVDMLQAALDMAKQNQENVVVTISTEDIYNTEATAEVTEEATAEAITEATTETTAEATTETTAEITVEEQDKGEYLYTQTKTTIQLNGIETIKQFYNIFGESFSKSMMDSWNELLKDTDTTNDNLSFDIITTNIDDSLGAGAYMTVDSQEYISWYFENYFPFEHWSLDSAEWEKEHTAQEFLDMTMKVQESITSIVNNFKSDLGLSETEEVQEVNDEAQTITESQTIEETSTDSIE